MSAIRLPLLCAFAGGCLSSAVLFGFWRTGAETPRPAQTQSSHQPGVVAASVIATNATTTAERPLTEEPLPAPSPEAHAEPATVEAQAAPSPGGSAVSDVLTDLEAAYRQRLIAAARAEAEAAAERPATPPATPIARAEPPRDLATPPSAARVVASVPAAPSPSLPNDAEPEAVAPPALPPTPAPAIVAQNDARPPDVHIGDVNQNTYITNVRQGDVYVVQQQLAMLQYMQMLGSPANLGVAPATHVARGAGTRQQQFRQFPSTLTNLDNPWGFNFSTPNLVH